MNYFCKEEENSIVDVLNTPDSEVIGTISDMLMELSLSKIDIFFYLFVF